MWFPIILPYLFNMAFGQREFLDRSKRDFYKKFHFSRPHQKSDEHQESEDS